MTDTTAQILEETKEQIKKEITESTVLDMVDNALDKLAAKYEEREREREERSQQFISEMRQKLIEELARGRTDWQSATRDFVTRDELVAKAEENARIQIDPVRKQFQDLFTDFNRERERTQQMLDQQIGQSLKLAKDSDTRSAANESAITALKETSHQRLIKLENDVDQIKRDIENNVKKSTQNSNSMHRMVADWIAKSDERDKKNDQIIRELKANQEQEAKKVEALVSKVQGAVDLAEDVDSRAGRNLDRLNYAIVGNKETKTEGLVDIVQAMRQEYKEQFEELRKEQGELSKNQQTVNDETWWLRWIGRHPYRTAVTALSLFVILLITIAGIFGRPDVVEAIVRAAT